MTDPEAQIRALLDAARPAYEPSPEDRQRVRAALGLSLVGAPAYPDAAPAGAASAAGSAAGGAALTKLVATALVAGAAGFGSGFATGRSTAPQASMSDARATAPAASQWRAERAAASTTPEPAPVEPLEPRAARPLPSTPAARASAGSTLWEEATLLREAQRALRGGDPDASLAMLDRMAERYPSGALEEERGAARVLALCGSGRNREARALAQRFLAEHPGSVHAGRVRASCAFPETPRKPGADDGF